VQQSLPVMAGMIKTMKVNASRMKAALEEGHVAATELADFLVRKGVPFRSAHGVVRNLVRSLDAKKKKLSQVTMKELKKVHSRFDESALALLGPEKVVRAKTSAGGTSPESVQRQIMKLGRLTK